MFFKMRVSNISDVAGIRDLKSAGEQVFEHFYFAIRAVLAGVGVVMGLWRGSPKKFEVGDC
jgi:hypothetical protein